MFLIFPNDIIVIYIIISHIGNEFIFKIKLVAVII